MSEEVTELTEQDTAHDLAAAVDTIGLVAVVTVSR